MHSKFYVKVLAFLFIAVCFAEFAYARGEVFGNTTNDSFSMAKRILERNVYVESNPKDEMQTRRTLYCGYIFDRQKNIHLPEGFSTPRHPGRARRLEWEHTVPAEYFGGQLPEWKYGHAMCTESDNRFFKGRKCAEKVNVRFRYMQADMYNLYPAVGAVNALRSNYAYAELPEMDSTFGQCTMKIDERSKRAEPADHAKGRVARAALYMAAAYPDMYRHSASERRLFEKWSAEFPVDRLECERTRRIEFYQGNENPFVKVPCQKLGLWQ